MRLHTNFMQVFISFFAFQLILTNCYSAEDCDGEYNRFYATEASSCLDSCLSFPLVAEATIAYDHFRSLPDGSWNGNNGAYIGVNLATTLPYVSDLGFGAQVGGSYGVYDWSGRGSAAEHRNSAQQQGFLTVGIFKKTCDCSGINFGLVYDWMANKNIGVFALNPHFDQVRFQVGYLFNGSDEVGFWATAPISKSHKSTNGIPVTFRAMGQANLFWKHTFSNCAWTALWAGAPYNRGLMFSPGRDGQYLIGASFYAPLTASLSISGHGLYMHPRSKNQKSNNDAVNICIGLTYTFGNSQGCQCNAAPYMTVADNSNFITDTNLNF